MKKIKIFVSNRIDIDSVKIENPLYFPIRCGAFFDKRKDVKIIGDNTGENISERRNSFCEFTVQYWAWKNINADYYGLCHYRRFLAFTKKIYRTNSQNHIVGYFLDKAAIRKYGLENEKCMREIIESNDIVVNKAANVEKISTPKGFMTSVYGHWAGHDGVFIDKRTIPILLKAIEKLAPEYLQYANEYLEGKWYRGYNCYIMKRALFDKMCEFQFTILFELEKQLNGTEYVKRFKRTLGYLGEIMYGIFIYYICKQKKYKVYETPIVYFEETEQQNHILKKYFKEILFSMKFEFEDIGFILLPKSSKRRYIIKKKYLKLLGK
jgi:hypothetical protein